MRDYGTVSPQFWIRGTGKSLRGDAPAQLLAMYLMTSPHSSMTGIYHCPLMYMAHETGLGIEGASKALARLIEAGFCVFDEASEYVFVKTMAAYQVGESLEPKDKRVVGIRKEVEKMPPGPVRDGFIATYSVAFHLNLTPPVASPIEAPSNPHRSQEQEQEQEQDQGQEQEQGETPAPRKRGAPPVVPRPDDVTEQTWGDWCALRKRKRANVDLTTLRGARSEADKAGVTLQRFLEIWCMRGSQGLEAAWLRADERRPAASSGKHSGFAEKDYRQGTEDGILI